jgi:hypothetical protein
MCRESRILFALLLGAIARGAPKISVAADGGAARKCCCCRGAESCACGCNRETATPPDPTAVALCRCDEQPPAIPATTSIALEPQRPPLPCMALSLQQRSVQFPARSAALPISGCRPAPQLTCLRTFVLMI